MFTDKRFTSKQKEAVSLLWERGYFERFSMLDKLQRKYFREALKEYRFTPNEIVVLLFLYNNAPVMDTASDIVRYRGISKGLVARSVESLCARGYLEAARDPDDRRIVHLKLKWEKNSIGPELEKKREDFCRRIEEGISGEELEITGRTLRALTENVERLLKGESEDEQQE